MFRLIALFFLLYVHLSGAVEFFDETKVLFPGESTVVGDTTIVCRSNGGTMTCPTTPYEQKRCRLKWSDGSCREWESTFIIPGRVSCTQGCQVQWSDGSCRVEEKCHFVRDYCCFEKEVCVTFWSDNSCREWQKSLDC